MIKSFGKRLKMILFVLKMTFMFRGKELTDAFILYQWKKENRLMANVRTINTLLALLIAQIAIIKNGHARKNLSNKKFLAWVSDALEKCLIKNRKNVDFYEKYHVRKINKRKVKRRFN